MTSPGEEFFARVRCSGSEFRRAQFSTDRIVDWGHAKQVRQILRQTGLTMVQVSTLTSKRYGKDTPYFIAPTFIYKQKKGITPHICQLAALSEITGYRLADWMKVCGLDPRMIFPIQLKIHTERTTLVTPDQSVVGFGGYLNSRDFSQPQSNKRHLFARIGRRDAVAYPRVFPGSIVRADRYCSSCPVVSACADDRLWLVEHPGGLTCCQIWRVDEQHVILLPNRPPLSASPILLSTEVRILGLVDLEFRPLRATSFDLVCHARNTRSMFAASDLNGKLRLSALLRSSRLRTGLTLRAAHDMTIEVARLLGNGEYGISLGLLSDYEAMNRLPRHVAKIMSLCIIYGIDVWELLAAGGIEVDDSKKTSLFQDSWEPRLLSTA